MRLKRLIAILLAAVLLSVLCACGQAGVPKPGTAAPNSAAVSNAPAVPSASESAGSTGMQKAVPAKKPIKPYEKGGDSVVALVQSDTAKKAEDLKQEDIDELVRRAVEAAGGLEGFVKDGDTVVLKPNLVLSHDYTLPGYTGKPLSPEVNGVTTDYRFTRAVARLVREMNPTGKIYVVEGSAENTLMTMNNLNYTKEFIPEADDFYGLEFISGDWQDKTSDQLVLVRDDKFILHSEYYVTKLIYDADVYISLPTLKNHWNATVTGGIKNLGIGGTPASIYGTSEYVPDRQPMVDHTTKDLYKWIADFFRARPADFVIMDGLQGIEHGPTPCYDLEGCTDLKDSQMNMRLVLAGSDAVAVDTVEADIMNWDYKTVDYLTHLNELGTGTTDARHITIAGNRSIDDVRKDFEGILPPIGGDRLYDKTAPVLKDVKAERGSGKLRVSFAADDTTVKAEVFLGGKPAGKAIRADAGSLGAVDVETGGIKSGAIKGKLVVYDEYFNSASAEFSVDIP
jgi:uncharacterized protein (DUF362 family)